MGAECEELGSLEGVYRREVNENQQGYERLLDRAGRTASDAQELEAGWNTSEEQVRELQEAAALRHNRTDRFGLEAQARRSQVLAATQELSEQERHRRSSISHWCHEEELSFRAGAARAS